MKENLHTLALKLIKDFKETKQDAYVLFKDGIISSNEYFERIKRAKETMGGKLLESQGINDYN